jgi:hypothetical protein
MWGQSAGVAGSPAVRRGRTRTTRALYPGVSRFNCGSISARAKRIRAAQAEDSATTVIVPLSRLHRFTLFASSGPSASITATCHSDVSGTEKARCISAGRRAEIRSPAVLGRVPGRWVCLFREGLLGIVSRLLGLDEYLVKRLEGAMTTRLPARSKSLMCKEQGREDPRFRPGPESSR